MWAFDLTISYTVADGVSDTGNISGIIFLFGKDFIYLSFKMDKGEIAIINEDVFITSGGSNRIRFKMGDFIRIINLTDSYCTVIDEVKLEGANPFMVLRRKITPIKNVEWKQLK